MKTSNCLFCCKDEAEERTNENVYVAIKIHSFFLLLLFKYNRNNEQNKQVIECKRVQWLSEFFTHKQTALSSFTHTHTNMLMFVYKYRSHANNNTNSSTIFISNLYIYIVCVWVCLFGFVGFEIVLFFFFLFFSLRFVFGEIINNKSQTIRKRF